MRVKFVQLTAGALLIGSLSLPWWRWPSDTPPHEGHDVATGWQVLEGGDRVIAIGAGALLVGALLPWAGRVRFSAVLATVAWVVAADVARYAVTGPECGLVDAPYTPQAGYALAIVSALVLAVTFSTSLRAAVRADRVDGEPELRTLRRWHVALVLPATLLVFVSLALPWFGLPYDSADESETAWSVFAGADSMIAFVAVALAVPALVPETRRRAAATALATLAGLLVLDIARYVRYDPDCFQTTMIPQAGLYLALAGATVTFAAYVALALRG